MARLRTGHCSLNKYLHRFNIIYDPNGEGEQGHETVEQYLLRCGLYEEESGQIEEQGGNQGNESQQASWRSQINKVHDTIHRENEEI